MLSKNLMEYRPETIEFTNKVKSNALRYGFDLVGIVSAETLDKIPSHYIAHRDYRIWTKKTVDYLKDSRSLIILGARVWDNLFDVVVKVRDHHEYPDEWRGRLYARRLVRFLNKEGYKTVLEPDHLSKKRMAQLAGFGNFGKNTLIINPTYGPWIRLRSILTNAELVPDKPFDQDLCDGCEQCVKSCPIGALTPYKVDPDTCLLGMSWDKRLSEEIKATYYEHNPPLTENTWLMCSTCQRACPIGRDKRNQKFERILVSD